MSDLELLIKKVSRYVSFGQPVSSGSVINQRISDPRVPISACYMSMKLMNEQEHYYYEIWLKKEGMFAVTEAWYKETTVSRSLLYDDLTYEQLAEVYGEEDSRTVIMRMNEIIKKSENEDWHRMLGSRRV
ncbi:hypothetical protein SK3146_05217 [Paenibacillus konkukensis]|uniref:Uncharacterized protein n=1 Tax=Paenibacillus konkukensis TaxID=2020716 RepID=A0ABY4RWW1_9BACL|nr:hypothetical protein [Paenibacillus konkukensis]UQZ85927.1 hypothetical protein SK3146_05217 [Paenibacillus konkukensis]